MSKEVGERIRKIRAELGLTMEEFGKLFEPEASKGVVSNWENDYNYPNKQRLEKVAELGGISVDDLLHGYKISAGMDKLINQVEQWSIDKNLHKAEPSKQMLKVVEELGEVAEALAKDRPDDLKGGIGDVVVTLIILAQQNDLTLEECLEQAYSEIEDRMPKEYEEMER